MEAEALELGLPAGSLEGGADTPPPARPVPLAEHPPLAPRTGKGRQRVIHRPIHRDLPPAAALRLLQQDHPTGKVHPLPLEAEDLPSPHQLQENRIMSRCTDNRTASQG